MSFVVTIDGPAAAGKSTTARAIAQRLGWRYLDSGAFYRALALKALRSKLTLTEFNASMFAKTTAINFSGDPDRPHLLLDGEDVTEAIRTVRPYGVDVSSGVESAPGKKDHAKIFAFLDAVRVVSSS